MSCAGGVGCRLHVPAAGGSAKSEHFRAGSTSPLTPLGNQLLSEAWPFEPSEESVQSLLCNIGRPAGRGLPTLPWLGPSQPGRACARLFPVRRPAARQSSGVSGAPSIHVGRLKWPCRSLSYCLASRADARDCTCAVFRRQRPRRCATSHTHTDRAAVRPRSKTSSMLRLNSCMTRRLTERCVRCYLREFRGDQDRRFRERTASLSSLGSSDVTL